MLLGLFVDFGALLGSQSFGLFLFVLLQTAVLSTALAATVAYQRRLGSPLILRMALLLGFALVPLFPGWALCVSQATLFAALTAWYVMFMVEAVRNPSAFLEKKWPLPAFFVLALLMPLVGESGIFMLLLSAPFLLFVRHAGARRAAVMGITAAVFFLVSALLLLPAAGVSVSSVKAPLPAAFQQSARCLAIHPTDVTPAETAAIGAVLDVSAAPSLYNAGLADPVAQTFKKDASGTAVTGYLGAWAQMGLRHPDTYALATLSNSYSYFYPGSYTSWTWTHVNRLGPGSQGDISELYRAAGVSFGQPEALEGPRNLVYESSRLFMLSPLSLPTNIGFAVWIVLFSCVLVLKQRKGAALAAFSPLLALMASFLVAPMNGDIRLALPLIATMPLLLTFALALLRQRRPQNERRRRKSANTPLKPQRPRRGWLVEAHTPSGGPGGLGGSGGGVSNGGAVTPSTATREGGRVPQYSEADHSYDSESAQAQDNDAARAGEGAEGSGTKAAESKPDITQRNTIRYS
jgi:hypothetical protein